MKANILCLIFLFFILSTQAQTITVVVTERSTQGPVIGCKIYNHNKICNNSARSTTNTYRIEVGYGEHSITVRHDDYHDTEEQFVKLTPGHPTETLNFTLVRSFNKSIRRFFVATDRIWASGITGNYSDPVFTKIEKQVQSSGEETPLENATELAPKVVELYDKLGIQSMTEGKGDILKVKETAEVSATALGLSQNEFKEKVKEANYEAMLKLAEEDSNLNKSDNQLKQEFKELQIEFLKDQE